MGSQSSSPILDASQPKSDQNFHQPSDYLSSQVALELVPQPPSSFNTEKNEVKDKPIDDQKNFIAQICFALVVWTVFEFLTVYILYGDFTSDKEHGKKSYYDPTYIPYFLVALYGAAFTSTRNFAKGIFVSLVFFFLLIGIASQLAMCFVLIYSTETDPHQDGFQVSEAGAMWFVLLVYIFFSGILQVITMIYVLCQTSSIRYSFLAVIIFMPLSLLTVAFLNSYIFNILLFVMSLSQIRFFINLQQGKCELRANQVLAGANQSFFSMIFPIRCY